MAPVIECSDPQPAIVIPEQLAGCELHPGLWKAIRLGFPINEASDFAIPTAFKKRSEKWVLNNKLDLLSAARTIAQPRSDFIPSAPHTVDGRHLIDVSDVAAGGSGLLPFYPGRPLRALKSSTVSPEFLKPVSIESHRLVRLTRSDGTRHY